MFRKDLQDRGMFYRFFIYFQFRFTYNSTAEQVLNSMKLGCREPVKLPL
ncbi:hypothetical protein [Ruminiclostridium cellobioparum]|nr:hypothetical protein [Ruminiclostridium cellobioparum]